MQGHDDGQAPLKADGGDNPALDANDLGQRHANAEAFDCCSCDFVVIVVYQRESLYVHVVQGFSCYQ